VGCGLVSRSSDASSIVKMGVTSKTKFNRNTKGVVSFRQWDCGHGSRYRIINV